MAISFLEYFNKCAMDIDLDMGDVVLGGLFKNQREVVKEISKDSNGQPTINGKKLLSFRIEKNLPENKKSKKTREMNKSASGSFWHFYKEAQQFSRGQRDGMPQTLRDQNTQVSSRPISNTPRSRSPLTTPAPTVPPTSTTTLTPTVTPTSTTTPTSTATSTIPSLPYYDYTSSHEGFLTNYRSSDETIGSGITLDDDVLGFIRNKMAIDADKLLAGNHDWTVPQDKYIYRHILIPRYLKTLKARFPKFDNFPKKVKEALFDDIYNTGANKSVFGPNALKDYNAGDLIGAGAELLNFQEPDDDQQGLLGRRVDNAKRFLYNMASKENVKKLKTIFNNADISTYKDVQTLRDNVEALNNTKKVTLENKKAVNKNKKVKDESIKNL